MTAKKTTTRKKTTKKTTRSRKKPQATEASCTTDGCEKTFLAIRCGTCNGDGCPPCGGKGAVNPATDTPICIDCAEKDAPAKPAPAARPKRSRKKATTAPDTAPAPDGNKDATPPPAAPKAAPKRRLRGKASPSMATLAEDYLKHLEAVGKSRGTVFSYSIDAALATKHFGAETPVTDLTPDAVAAYFESETVTKTRTGKPKANPTIDKTRRVLRLMLTWAAEAGIIPEAPLPSKESTATK